jgi:hypothetical protein
MYEWSAIGPDELLEAIIPKLFQWNEMLLSSGVRLELGSPDERGMKLAWTLTVKTLVPSSGVAIRMNQILWLMNFVEVSTLPIFFGGWTVILSEWKLRDLQEF